MDMITTAMDESRRFFVCEFVLEGLEKGEESETIVGRTVFGPAPLSFSENEKMCFDGWHDKDI